jgi:RNA polymerase sigma factor (sigma-70 family)
MLRCPMLAGMGADVLAPRRRNVLPAAVLRVAPDRRLVDEVHAGSERAFEVLFTRHHRPVLAFCRHMLGSREEAEDAAQQTFLTAYREIARGEQPRALRPWLYTIARHRCLSALRGRRRRSLGGVPERAADTLLTEVTAREDLRAILADVARLPYDQRAALVLAELGDISHEEIARIVECPREKVKALVFQARSSLAAERTAREISCAEVQEQLAVLRGGALRRGVLRRHLDECPGCRAFRDTVRVQRRRLGLLLPGAPIVALKRAVLGTLFGSGGGAAGGGALTIGALGGAGLALTAVVAVAIPGGPFAAGGTASREGREPAPVAPATAPHHPAASASSWTPRGGTHRAASDRVREAGSATTPARQGAPLSKPSPQARENARETRPAPYEPPGARDPADEAHSVDQVAPANPSAPPAGDVQKRARPAKPPKPPQANRQVTPAAPAKPDHAPAPANPEKAYGQIAPGKPPAAPGEATPVNENGQNHTPPAAAADSAPTPGADPSPGGAPAPGALGTGGDAHGLRPSRPRP